MTDPAPASSSLVHRLAGPILIAIAAMAMLAWSWGTWPDPLVDFGMQLYVPWQISQGHALYRDIAYYNGPLSQHLNAAAFLIFGVGLNTLVYLNLLILGIAMILAYRLTAAASGRLAATVAGITFALVFAFGQIVQIGNYNWVTPYVHEITHGTVLALAAIAGINRSQRTRRPWLLAWGGALLGAVFLTKAEPTAAAFAAVAALMVGHWWITRTTPRQIFWESSLLIVCTLAAPIAAWALLSAFMPGSIALRGVLGSWPWVLDRRITSLHFYRQVAGLDDIAGNLRTMLKWSVVYARLIGGGVGLGLLSRSRRSRSFMTAGSFLVCSAILIWCFSERIVAGMLMPLPVCLGFALLFTLVAVIRRSSPLAPLRFALVVFAAALVGKMGFAPFAYFYGFVLAWPATVVLICAVTTDLPAWVNRHGGTGRVVQTIGLSAWLAAIAAVLHPDKNNFDAKRSVIFSDSRDQFCGDQRGLQIQQIIARLDQLVPPGGTVAVLPQGLMINYLSRRATPTPFINLMPPEVIAAGEPAILAAMQAHPPAAILLTLGDIENGHFTLDGRDPYGVEILKWVKENYTPVDPEPVGALERKRTLQILRRKS